MLFLKSRFKRYVLFSFVLIACFQGQAGADTASARQMTSAQEQNQAAPTQLQPESGNEYLLGPDDQIKMTVFGEEELTGVYTVNANGMLSIPLIGDVQAKNQTLKQLETEIIKKFENGYLIDPSIALEIAKYRPFYILGEVRLPGSYNYVTDINVLNAAALAGGFTYRANKKRVQIRRPGQDGEDTTEEQPVEYKIQPGDVILVKERFF